VRSVSAFAFAFGWVGVASMLVKGGSLVNRMASALKITASAIKIAAYGHACTGRSAATSPGSDTCAATMSFGRRRQHDASDSR